MALRNTVFWLLLAILASCNSIKSGHFVLTDTNSEAMEHRYPYWFALGGFSGKRPVLIQDFEKGKKQKVWTLAPYPKTKKEPAIYMRSHKLTENRLLYQFTSWDKKKEIYLYFGHQPNDSTMVLYGLTDAAMEKAKQSATLKALGTHVSFTKDEIYFDSIAATNHAKTILKFLDTQLNHKAFFKTDSLVFYGAQNPNAFVQSP